MWNRKLLQRLLTNTENIMSDLSDLQAKFKALQDAVTKEDSDINTFIDQSKTGAQALKDQIAALQAQIAAGSPATAADLQALSASADSLLANVTAADAAVNAAAAPPPTP